jgi:hypothetical protein
VMTPPARLNMCHCFTGRDGRKSTADAMLHGIAP